MLRAFAVPRDPGPLVTQPQLRECHGCGLFQIVPAMAANMRSDCERCGTPLRATRADPTGRCLALTFASLVLFAVLWLAMLMKVSTAGIVHETTILSGPSELVRHGLWPLALAVSFTTAFAPLIKFAGTLYVLVGLRMRTLPPNLRGIFLIARRMGTWAMLEVLLLGVFVAYTKLGDLVTIQLGPAVYALGVLTVVIVWAELALDPQAVWEEIERRGQTHAPMPPVAPLEYRPGAAGCEDCKLVCVPAEHDGRCPRCGARVHERKPDSLNRTLSLALAGAILYIPANVYPVLTVIQLGSGAPSTIMGGVEELVSSKMYPLALLVFFASVLVPLFKLISLIGMISVTSLPGTAQTAGVFLRQRTKLYFIVAWIGRWSMVDIFMESLLGALVQFGRAVTIDPGMGALAFCAVVIVTIFAAEAFDPRLMWDAAARNPHRQGRPSAAPSGAAVTALPSG
ncbi:paraquat-inducible protein A [Reyranella sp.]|uniref:paraquat-inducible protein A n=1 Tax=Reyranella sp. TaxID=1929291 RepID=UPI003BAB1FF5